LQTHVLDDLLIHVCWRKVSCLDIFSKDATSCPVWKSARRRGRALIEISLKNRIPILGSNKLGIEEGATFGPVADFQILGRLSDEMAARIPKEGIQPARLQSKIQDPPSILINKRSAEIIGIPEEELSKFQYVE